MFIENDEKTAEYMKKSDVLKILNQFYCESLSCDTDELLDRVRREIEYMPSYKTDKLEEV